MIIEAKDVVKHYKEKLVLDHMDLEIGEGEIFGLLGPNGSGKTTFIKCLLDLASYEKGTIKIFDKSMKERAYEIKKNIGIVMQDIGVYDELTVYENVDYFCSLYIKDAAKRRELVDEAIEMVDLQEQEKAYPSTLSGGMLRRLNIACGVAHKPKLIIFDEPTIAIDVNLREKIIAGIKRLNRMGSTILYTSHYMEEVEVLCNQIAIMNNGKVVARGSKEALLGMIEAGENISIEVDEMTDEILNEIKSLPHVERVRYEERKIEVQYTKGKNNLITLLDYLAKREIHIGDISDRMPNLNDVFKELTGKELARQVSR